MRYRSITLIVAVGAGLLLWGASPDRLVAAQHGKPQAPVEIGGIVELTKASLAITFEKNASGVEVRVYGTDGLVVQGSETKVIDGTFSAGETLDLEVFYAPGAGHSNLAVVVSGQFGGSQRSRVASFTVGDEKLPSQSRANTTTSTETGEHLIIMPAKRK